jgi:hypothetical protein
MISKIKNKKSLDKIIIKLFFKDLLNCRKEKENYLKVKLDKMKQIVD